MKVSDAIKNHERAIAILEGIQSLHRRKSIEMQNQEGVFRHFPKLIRKSENRVDTLDRAIKRLTKAYFKQLVLLQ